MMNMLPKSAPKCACSSFNRAENRKGDNVLMRLMNHQLSLAAGLGSLLLTIGAWAGPALESWDLQQTSDQERLRIRWSEPAPVEIDEFRAARQVVLTIPEASMPAAALPSLDLASSRAIDGVRAVPVTLPDGRDAVQLTLSLRNWQPVHTHAGASWLTISLQAPTDAASSSP